MKLPYKLLLCAPAFFLFACGDDSSSSSSDETQTTTATCDYDATTGYYFCQDENGNYTYAMDADGNIIDLTTSSDSEGSSASDGTETTSCVTDSDTFKYALNGISYYTDGTNTYYYSDDCTKNYLTTDNQVEVEVSSSATETSSATDTGASSSSEVTAASSSSIIAQSSSSAVGGENTDGDPEIVLSSSGATISNDNSCIDNSNTNYVIITCAGNYYISGSSDDFQIVVNAGDDDKVYLYLNGVTLTSSDAPIYVQNADKAFLMLVDGTTNTFVDASTRTRFWTKSDGDIDTTKACIYAKDDLTIKGNGTLNVTSNYGNGIHTSNDLKIKDAAVFSITAANHAIKGKGSVEIEGGYLTLNATGDGIKSDEGSDDDEEFNSEKGYVLINGGEITIKASDDGIQASNYIMIADTVSTPIINITSTGKAIVADTALYMNAGQVTIDATDDGLHSNGTININGGSFVIASDDDGIHADETFNMNGGTVYISTSYEGIEAYVLNMNGGYTHVISTDDGWNAAGGTDDSSSSEDNFGNQGMGQMGQGGTTTTTSTGTIFINGGYHYVYVSGSDVDGIDSNGDIYLYGGYLIIESANNIIDKGDNNNYVYYMGGGTILGIGTQNEGVPSDGTCLEVSNSSSNSNNSMGGMGGNSNQGGTSSSTSISTGTVLSAVSSSTVLLSYTVAMSGSKVILISSESDAALYTGGSVSGGTTAWSGYLAGMTIGGTLSNGTAVTTSTCSEDTMM